MRNEPFGITFFRAVAAGLLAGGLLLGNPARGALSQAPAPAVAASFPAGSAPSALLVGSDQAVWVSLASGNALIRVSGAQGQSRVDLTTPSSRPYDLTLGPDRGVWFSQQAANQVGRTLAQNGETQEFALTSTPGDPTQIAQGQDGRVWFTEFAGNRLGWIRPDGTSGYVSLAAASSRPLGLAVDAVGNIWFTEWNAARLGRIDGSGSLREISLPASPAHPAEIILGPDNAMWFTYENTARVGRLDLDTETVTVFPVETSSNALADLAVGADGRIWFIGFQTVGSFAASAAGPADLTEMALDTAIFEGSGRTQIIQGPGSQVYFIKASAQNLYAADISSAVYRDLQLSVEQPPSPILSGGPFAARFTIYNASQAQASGVTLRVPLPAQTAFDAADLTAGGCLLAGAEVVCSLDVLAGGEEWQVGLSLIPGRNPAVIPERTLTARVSADQDDYLLANNRVQRALDVTNAIVYSTGFTGGADSHWSSTAVFSTGGANQALGPLANDTVRMTFTGMPPHDEASLCFDLLVLGGWDGSQAGSPDQWSYTLDGQPFLATTFSNQAAFRQSYPGAYPDGDYPAQSQAKRTGDLDGDGQAGDASYTICKVFSHSGPGLEAVFSGAGLDPSGMERWALDNVSLRTNYHNGLYYLVLSILWIGR